MRDPPSSTGLVLAGAAALGAYEVGVLSHLVEDVARCRSRSRNAGRRVGHVGGCAAIAKAMRVPHVTQVDRIDGPYLNGYVPLLQGPENL
jgi:hypothetical protein